MKKTVEKYMSDVKELIEFLKSGERIFIQPHNFPDHDAISSAFSFQKFLKAYDLESTICYDKEIQRSSLMKMIKDLGIEVYNFNEIEMSETDRIILVDGCKGNANMTDLPGNEVAVIDHHIVRSPDDVEFSDIHEDYGSCSTIIGEYFMDNGISMSREVATAIMVGVSMDTALLTRGVHESDLKVYFYCYSRADTEYVNSVLRNYIRIPDLDNFRYIIEHTKYEIPFAFCHFPHGCSQNLLGLLADFMLALEEINFVFLSAHNGPNINFSVRSERHEWDASVVIREVLKGIGFGGGHHDMAGGVIKNPEKFHKLEIWEKVISILKN